MSLRSFTLPLLAPLGVAQPPGTDGQHFPHDFLPLSMLAQSDALMVTSGREMRALHGREDVTRGTCDGRPASATITKAGRDQAGRLVLRIGRFVREVPQTFLDGQLFGDRPYSAGLGCDGRTLLFRALTVRLDARGEAVLYSQSATMDLRTGVLTVAPPRTTEAADTRVEFGD